MRILLVLSCALCALIVAPPAVASPAVVRLASCEVSDSPTARSAIWDGRMSAIRGTRRMAIRFTLYERLGSGEFVPVQSHGLGVWRSSRRGVERFQHRIRVEPLKAGASYRADAQFRWSRASGKVLRSVTRRGPICKQPEALPNLRVRSIEIKKVEGDTIYSVEVANTGSVEARFFSLAVTVDGARLAPTTVPALAPLAAQTFDFSGPACRQSVEAVADAENAIRELSESDNLKTLPC